MIKHMIKQVSHADIEYQPSTQKVQPKAREIKGKTLSLEAYDLCISPPLATTYQKVCRCIVLCVSLGFVFRRWCRDNSKDEDISRCCWSWWSGNWGGTEAVAAGAEVVALVSAMGTTADL